MLIQLIIRILILQYNVLCVCNDTRQACKPLIQLQVNSYYSLCRCKIISVYVALYTASTAQSTPFPSSQVRRTSRVNKHNTYVQFGPTHVSYVSGSGLTGFLTGFLRVYHPLPRICAVLFCAFCFQCLSVPRNTVRASFMY